jgi:hypothetical protein
MQNWDWVASKKVSKLPLKTWSKDHRGVAKLYWPLTKLLAMNPTSNVALKKRLNLIFKKVGFIYLLASSKPTPQTISHTIEKSLGFRFGKAALASGGKDENKGFNFGAFDESCTSDFSFLKSARGYPPALRSHPSSHGQSNERDRLATPLTKTPPLALALHLCKVAKLPEKNPELALLSVNRPFRATKSTVKLAIEKTLHKCKAIHSEQAAIGTQVCINANQGGHPTKKTPLTYDEGLQRLPLQKVTVPKHVLNHYCLNINLPIKGCRIDLLILGFSNPRSLESSQSLANAEYFTRLQKTYQVSMFSGSILKQGFYPDLQDRLSNSYSSGQATGQTWHANQLLGAFVKDLEGNLFYISSSEIKQTLLLQWHFEQVFPRLKSAPTSKPFLIHSFKAIQGALQDAYAELPRLITKLYKNLVFRTTHPLSKLQVNFALGLKNQLVKNL